MDKKYEITNIEHPTIKGLFRIQSIRAIPGVTVGELGGYVESEDNLLHEGYCWVSREACVSDKAIVGGDAIVTDNAHVSDRAVISECAVVAGRASVNGSVCMKDHAVVTGDSRVTGHVVIKGRVCVRGHAFIGGDVVISGNVEFRDRAHIIDPKSYVVFQNVGSEQGTLTAFKDSRSDVRVVRGCFTGTLEDFGNAVEERHGGSQIGDEYRAIIEVIKIRFGLK